MQTFWKLSPIAAFIITFSASTTLAATLPGTPCSDLGVTSGPCSASTTPSTGGFGTLAVFNLPNDPGNNPLPIFVVPGDVVVFESPTGSLSNRSTWSDVVRFQNFPGANVSTATIFPDGESGAILPAGFTLSDNATSVVELQTGTGNDLLDITNYTAGTATYQIHSDAASPELPENPEPEPSTLLLFGSGLVAASMLARFRRTLP